MKPLFRPRRSRRGSQAVEFALILPVMMALTSGIIDYGWFYSQQLQVVSAARDGARGASQLDSAASPDDPCTFAVTQAQDILTEAGVTGATVHATGAMGGSEMRLTVEVTAAFPALFGLAPVPPSYYARVVARLEDQAWGACDVTG